MPRKEPKPIPELSQADIARFWGNVDKSGGPDACWPYRNVTGYGLFRLRKGVQISAHRLAYRLHYGHDPFPETLHSCDFPPCCNPAHISEGTAQMNAADRCSKGRGYGGDDHWSRVSPEKVPRGEHNVRARFTKDDILKIRQLRASGMKYIDIGALFNARKSTISNIIQGRSWNHLK